jgi:hypothetical protein
MNAQKSHGLSSFWGRGSAGVQEFKLYGKIAKQGPNLPIVARSKAEWQNPILRR